MPLGGYGLTGDCPVLRPRYPWTIVNSRAHTAVAIFIAINTVVALSSGCSGPCQQPDVAGDYELKSRGDRFQLHLSPDGHGRLSRNGELIETLTWQREHPSELVFMNVSSASTRTLDALKYTNLMPPDAVQWTSAHYGLTPECTRSGAVNRLGLNVGGPPYFVRVN